MKNKILIALLAVATLWSCSKLEVENPNGGTAPSFETAKEGAAYTYTGELGRISAMFLQQLKGNDIHYEPIYEQYVLADLKLQNTYNTAYRHGVSVAIDAGTDEGKLLAALIYSVTIEFFDNAEKYMGRQVDPTQLTYADIENLLNGVGGDYELVADMLMARLYINRGDYANALSAIPSGMTFEDGYKVMHAGSSTSMNEWGRFQTSRGGYLTPDSVNIVNDLMLGDPRLAVYYNDGVSFGFPMTKNEAFLIDYAEVKFIEAEAALETNDAGRAATAFADALTASFDLAGVDGTAFIAANPLPADKDQAKELILTQKYIHLFGHPQAFVDYRRTTYPAITLKNANFPTKWHYYYQ